MGKVISSTKLSDTLTITECTDGFWLYDTTRGMNLSMRAKTETDAFVEAITYYQNRLEVVQRDYSELLKHVNGFVQKVIGRDEDS